MIIFKCDKKIINMLVIVLCLTAFGCSKNYDIVKNKKTIIDMAGDEVEITNEVKNVISLIPYGGQFFVGLGLSEYVLAVSDDNVESKWWEVVCPNFDKIKIINEEESAESLLNLIQILF